MVLSNLRKIHDLQLENNFVKWYPTRTKIPIFCVKLSHTNTIYIKNRYPSWHKHRKFSSILHVYLTTVCFVLKTVHVIIRISDQEILLTSVISLRRSCFFYNFRALEMVKGKFTKIFLSQLKSEMVRLR